MATSSGVGQYVAAERHVGCTGRYTKANGKRAVIIHGGRGQTALSNMPPDTITGGVAETGAPVAYFDCVDGKQWGNDTSRSRIDSLWSFLQSNFGAKSDKVALYGTSMGGAVLGSWALANPTKVACLALLIPGANIGDIYDNNRTASLGFTASTDIDTAYGGAGSFSGTVRSTHDPAANTSAFTGFPVRIWYSGNDPVIVPSVITAFATAIGAPATNIGDLGHSAVGADPKYGQQILSFIAASA